MLSALCEAVLVLCWALRLTPHVCTNPGVIMSSEGGTAMVGGDDSSPLGSSGLRQRPPALPRPLGPTLLTKSCHLKYTRYLFLAELEKALQAGPQGVSEEGTARGSRGQGAGGLGAGQGGPCCALRDRVGAGLLAPWPAW